MEFEKMDEKQRLIYQAFLEAEKRRPYAAAPALVARAIPVGGEWECVAPDGAISRSILWNGREVALVNPRGDIDDETEGQIAMAMAALPLLDATIRTILVLAESADNLPLIRELAAGVIVHVERPAPRFAEAEDC
jgi:hypothetical protein